MTTATKATLLLAIESRLRKALMELCDLASACNGDDLGDSCLKLYATMHELHCVQLATL